MDPILVAAIYEALKQDKKKRKYWVHPLNTLRIKKGQFHTLYDELRQHPDKAFEYYRMSIQTFDVLLVLTKVYITKKDTKLRSAICPEERLTVTLRYLSTGMTFKSLSHDFLMGRSTIARIVKETCKVLWDILQPLEMPEPNKESWLKVAEDFYKYANFPNCLGAVDGKHIRIINPNNSGSAFFNYKKFFSIILMAVADSNYCFVSIDVGSYGKEADSNIFRNSNFGKKLYQGMFDLPNDSNLPGTNGPAVPFVLVADEAFALHKHVMRPYPNKTLDLEKRTFNYRLSRARRYVECTFGIMTNKWRILHSSILTDPSFSTEIVKTTCVLHNFVRRRDGLNQNDELLMSELSPLPHCNTSRAPSAINTREVFKKYFMEEGKLEWQHNFI